MERGKGLLRPAVSAARESGGSPRAPRSPAYLVQQVRPGAAFGCSEDSGQTRAALPLSAGNWKILLL